jgi:hypothetical protein
MVALALTVASPAVAFPIMYVFTGTGTGSVITTVGTTSFTNAAFEVSLISDTTGASTAFGGTTISNDALAGTVSISGLGSFNLTARLHAFVSNDVDAVGFGPAFFANDIFDIFNMPSLASMDYDLISVYPRETGLGPTCCAGAGFIFTDGGLVRFSAFGNTGTFEAIVEGVPDVPNPLLPTPEPGTLSLLTLGFATVGVRRLRYFRDRSRSIESRPRSITSRTM